jgi:hypothetical protein
MTDFEHLTERMPAVARGRGEWGAAEATHLASCAACRAEWELVRTAHSLGASVAAGLDTGRVAAAVRRSLRAAPLRDRVAALRRVRRVLVGLAAAAALVLVAQYRWGHGARDVVPVHPAPGAASSMLPELDGLTATELQAVLESFSPAAESLPHVETGLLDDLQPQELERVLRSLEG